MAIVTRLRALLLMLPAFAASAQTPAPYTEPYRPQVHFSPAQHWMNDPNGLVFFEGEYHLFFQFNPFGDTPGHISWGHAVSRDLLHWQELPVAIPATDTELVFTGSVVVDEKNTSGQCEGGKPCLIAIYTAHNDTPHHEAQSMAISQDRGRTWKRFAGNPVLDRNMDEFRDPSVSWNDETKSWLMAVSMPNQHQVVFYTAPDLIHWTQLTTFGPAGTTAGQWECPDLLKIPSANGKQSLYALKVGLNPGSLQGGSGEQYFLGSFDGKTFTQSQDPGSHGWTDYGKDSYCAISYNHLPKGDPPTLIGWMDNWQYADKLPTSPWRGQMTIPRHLTLFHDQAGLSLQQQPVTKPIREGAGTAVTKSLTQPSTSLFETDQPTELTLTLNPADAQTFGLRFYSDQDHFTEVAFDRSSMRLYTDRTHATTITAPNFPARTEAPILESRPFDLHLVLDRSSVEVFAQNGTIAMTTLTLPTTQHLRVELFRTQGTHPLKATGHRWTLHPIWPTKS